MSDLNPDILRYIKYLSFKMDCLREQQENPLTIDREKAEGHRKELEATVGAKREELAQAMPKTVIEHTRPKTYKKKDGTLSVAGEKWDKKCEEFGQPKGCIRFLEYKEGNPGSDPQLKEWLFGLGWDPCTYKFVRNKKTGEEKKIPQVRYHSANDPRKGELTDSIVALIEKEPSLQALDGLTMAKHRLSIFENFLKHSDENGLCPASAGGFTNTLRFQHRNPFVNMPKADGEVPWGEEIRGCIVAPEGYEVCGSDVVSLEASTKRHFMYPHDPEYADAMGEEGFDEHLDLSVHAGALTYKDIEEKGKQHPEIKSTRKQYKATNYCLPMDTKVLTKDGWKSYEDIEEGEVLPVYDHYSNKVIDGTVEKKHFYKDTEVVTMANSQSSVTCTPNHRWYSSRRVNLKGTQPYYVMDYVETNRLRKDDNIILSAPYQPPSNVSEVTPYEAMFMGFVLSDGYFKWSPESNGPSTSGGKKRAVTCMVAQSKNKYWGEVEKCLVNIGVSYRKDIKEESNGNDVYKYYLTSASARDFLDHVMGCRSNPYDYNWTKWVMSLSRQSLESFYYGFYLGDGDMKGKHVGISQNEGAIFDAIVAASQLLGWGRVGVTGNSKCKYVRLHHTERMTLQKINITLAGKEDTFCLTTSHGSFIIWQNGFVGITGNSAIYGVGPPKLARELFITVSKAALLLGAYWDRNWSIKKVAEEQYVKTLKDGSMWLKNPVSGFYYSLRYMKDVFSTLNQGTGVYIFDSWLLRCRKKGIVIPYQYHDELLTLRKKSEETREELESKLHEAMDEVNESLKLNVDVKVDVQFGQNYAEVH